VCHQRDGADSQQHDQRAVARDRTEVSAEVSQRCGERAPVEQRWDEDQEERARIEIGSRQAGQRDEREASEDQQHGMRHSQAASDHSERGGHRQEHDDQLDASHG
jgi:hypothetical protein